MMAQAPDHRYRPLPLPSSSWPREIASVGNCNNSFEEPGASFPASNIPAPHLNYGYVYGQGLRSRMQLPQDYATARAWRHNVPQGRAQNTAYDAQYSQPWQPREMQMATPDITSTHARFKAGSGRHPGQQQQSPTQGYQNRAMGNTRGVPVITTVPQAGTSAVVGAMDDGGSSEKALMSYTREFGAIFSDINNGSLERALEALLSFTSRLESEVVNLGADSDYNKLGGGELEFWNKFNNAWLAFCEKQKEVIGPLQQLSTTQVLKTKDITRKMGGKLVALCDKLEPHGLVDYEYGVLEEQITAALEDLLDSCEEKETLADAVTLHRDAFASDPVQPSDLAV